MGRCRFILLGSLAVALLVLIGGRALALDNVALLSDRLERLQVMGEAAQSPGQARGRVDRPAAGIPCTYGAPGPPQRGPAAGTISTFTDLADSVTSNLSAQFASASSAGTMRYG